MLFGRGETNAFVTEDRWGNEFPRVVPYVSAACLLLRRSAYSALGGLDTCYGRGYFEDVELSLELEACGAWLAVVPASRAFHVRGGSSTSAISQRQTILNRDVFVARWRDRLAQFPALHPADGTRALLRGRDAFAADRILIIDDRVPHVDRGSGDVRMAHIAGRMAACWPSARVTLLATTHAAASSDAYAPLLLEAGVEVADCQPGDEAQWLQHRAGHYSAVVISRPNNLARYGGLVERTQPQALLVVDMEAS